MEVSVAVLLVVVAVVTVHGVREERVEEGVLKNPGQYHTRSILMGTHRPGCSTPCSSGVILVILIKDVFTVRGGVHWDVHRLGREGVV